MAADIDEVVVDSLEKIREVDPCGPYRLSGWSFGGIVAHRIATRLRSEGYRVERLILFDSYPPELPIEDQPRNMDEIWREIALGTNLAIPRKEFGEELNASVILALAREQSHILGTFSLDHLNRLAAVLANNSRLVSTARLDRFDGHITLFAATRQTTGLDRTHATPDSWRPFCRSLRTVPVDAEHHQMLSPAALRQIAGTFNDASWQGVPS